MQLLTSHQDTGGWLSGAPQAVGKKGQRGGVGVEDAASRSNVGLERTLTQPF